jgi:transcriptional regulator with XRE-family HTH domain
MARKERSPLAQRLDKAAARSGLTNEEISERLGVTAGNVSHWRTGRHRPDVETIQRFAAVVNASDYFLMTGRDDPAQLVLAFQSARQLWREAIARGEDAALAWEAIVGQEGRFTDEERQQLSGETSELSRFLVSVDGLEWIGLTGEQHRIVRDLVRLLARSADAADQRSSTG